jgi:hypothetical protein
MMDLRLVRRNSIPRKTKLFGIAAYYSTVRGLRFEY